MEAGKNRLAGDTARAANTDKLKELRRKAKDLTEVVAEQRLELGLLNKGLEPSFYLKAPRFTTTSPGCMERNNCLAGKICSVDGKNSATACASC